MLPVELMTSSVAVEAEDGRVNVAVVVSATPSPFGLKRRGDDP
jgi:hypothetical protein